MEPKEDGRVRRSDAWVRSKGFWMCRKRRVALERKDRGGSMG